MGEIKWDLVVTQIVGFLLVLWILRKYAWGPVVSTLESRRDKIRSDFEDIDRKKGEVASLQSKLEAELREIESQARAKIQEGVHEGERVGAEIKEKARQDAQAMIHRAGEQIEQDRNKAQVELRNQMVTMVIAAAEKILGEKLDPAAQKGQIDAFLQSLGGMKSGGRSES
ncbi:MAG: F0F1 ATP synthase subunit B [Candidatus Eisenbacteria bacterium]|uniref:ATP synthase subunit b n=1 Tax=Eiseniibacteriota bacterium TaxID=2212470 RepID=A0A956LYH1_UNCEI|nr:F0F1 ATP synthase subunit B [Candidatus Eisenbacteria bacterium]